MALFAALGPEATAALLPSLSHLNVNHGDVVFAEGDAGEALYVIEDGKIKLSRSAADGRENILAVLGPNKMFGELPCSIRRLAPQGPRR